MFEKVLVANRGEIAVRVIRACHDLGIKAVAVHSEADSTSLHCRIADEKVCIGEAASKSSYLDVPSILSAAEITKCDAIHPGYGFLSENATFADVCASVARTFIGPPASAIRLMGDKAAARSAMIRAGVPVVPGSEGAARDEAHALSIAREIGYPVLLKAVAGGGGRGMRVVESEGAFSTLYQTASGEALAAFSNGSLYVEKFLSETRHVEIQIFADAHGNVVHVGERDCSLQRRHQKLVEESPSPALSDATRDQMGAAAILAARSAGYVGAGTVEFLLDRTGKFFFIEMNTRIQVEHPVTEELYGVDLVQEQLKVASGERLSFTQDVTRTRRGHVMEFRVNAEDPDKDFMANPGTISSLVLPGGPGVRVDTHVYAGYSVPPFYDSLIGKLIVRGATRELAFQRAERALSEFEVEGIKTTIPFHRRLLRHPDFKAGKVHTKWVERTMAELAAPAAVGARA